MIEPELFRAHDSSTATVALDIGSRIGSTIAHRAWDKV
jgi:hypothetical protein